MVLEILKHKANGKKIGITFSSFDLLHAGHNLMLSEAKSQCDILIACLQTNPTIDRPEKNKPVQSVFERWTQLQSIKDVDYVIPYETEKELEDILLTIQPHIRIVGEEYRDKEFTGKHLTPVYYNSRKHGFSTSSLRNKINHLEIHQHHDQQ